MSSVKEIKIQVHEKLVETGEYEKLKAQLRLKLMESGWFDSVNEIALDKLSTEENPNFDLIANSLEEQALNLVPDSVKVEMLQKIRKFLDTWTTDNTN